LKIKAAVLDMAGTTIADEIGGRPFVLSAYSRTFAPEGIELACSAVPPGELFHRQLSHQEFDVSEMSFSTLLIITAQGSAPWVALPIFSTRTFFGTQAVVRNAAGIEQPADLKGKRVNVGNPGSGQRGTMEVVMKAKGWTMKDFKLASELKSAEQSKALCDNKIDAYFWLVGHPSALTQETLASCPSHLVNARAPKLDELVKKTPYYAFAVIPGGLYPQQKEDVPTWGVRATLVTASWVPEDVVYNLVKSVFDNFDAFKKLHPAFGHLKPEEMISAAISAPLHPGAVKYYKERGWMK